MELNKYYTMNTHTFIIKCIEITNEYYKVQCVKTDSERTGWIQLGQFGFFYKHFNYKGVLIETNFSTPKNHLPKWF